LAAEVLDGRINFLRRFTKESYKLLEGSCWLDDVRKLKAHLLWQEHDGGWGEEGMCRDYLDACEKIRQKLVDPDVKLSQMASEPILEYIKTEYLSRRPDNTWELNGGKTNILIEIKARRVWQLTRNTDEKKNWNEAEQYTKDFYENIIPAVTGDAKKIEKVMDALQMRGDLKGPNLVNCFEVAVAIHCVDHGEIRKYLQLAQGAKAA
jgi:hypothetical protein